MDYPTVMVVISNAVLVHALTIDILLMHVSMTLGSSGEYFREDLKLLSQIGDTQMSKLRPTVRGEPTVVSCNININSFDSVSESSMDYELTIFLRQAWHDPRLRHNSTSTIVINGGDVMDMFWVPDLFFTNAKSVTIHSTPKENLLLRIDPSGNVLYSLRLSLVLSCYMFLGKFPMDTQECHMQLESYSYNMNELVLKWLTNTTAVEIHDEVELPQYYLEGIKEFANVTHYMTGDFTHLGVSFSLVRSLGFYVLQAYVPSSLLVALSWLSVWVEISAAPARVALGVTTVLALVTQATWLRSQLPKIAYATAIDVWMVTCQVLVFLALLEYSVVYYLYSFEKGQYAERRKKREYRRTIRMRENSMKDAHKGENQMTSPKVSARTVSYEDDGDSNNVVVTETPVNSTAGRVRPRLKERPPLVRQETQVLTTAELIYASNDRTDYLCLALRIDRFSRIFLPLIFCILCILYWSFYPIQKHSFSVI
ncbi:glycine receptor subunit alpha-4-like [Saccoglossus kowalevskii]|uniref:Gamma-aminobutyric acid receptor subunit beta n=1 Tax=Saccoglossus kowalevskii TaxID=10224 RepID=A0A0U2UAR0_SACKO|nr:glycine receptor subunit alpha-3-like 274 [Saccoglossus kowalevskii]